MSSDWGDGDDVWRFHKLVSVDDFRYFNRWADTAPADRAHSFGKRTVIYGPNGSGKSTLADLFCAVQEAQSGAPVDARLEGVKFALTDGTSIRQTKGTGADLPRVLVFGQQYIERNLREAFEGPDAIGTPLYVVGEQDANLADRISDLESAIATAAKEREAAKQALAPTKRDHDRAASTIKNDVHDHLATYNPGRYNRTIFSKPRVEQLIAKCPDSSPLGAEDMQACLKDLQKEPTSVALDIDVPTVPDATPLLQKLEEIAKHDVVSRPMARHAKSRVLADWAQAGLALHEPGDECAFCGQAVLAERLDDLRAHFDESYRQLQRKIESCTSTLDSMDSAMATTHQELERLAGGAGPTAAWIHSECTRFTTYFAGVRECSEAARSFLLHREQTPFEMIAWEPPRMPDAGVWADLLDVAQRENAALQQERDNVDQVREAAAQSLLAHIAARHRDEFLSTKGAVEDAEARLSSLDAAEADLKRQLQNLQAQRLRDLDGKKLADELSTELQRYLGPRQLTVEFIQSERQQGFVFLRDGKPARNLSEGERGAIALLHFLRSLDTADNEPSMASTCVVIDDPVSSLDNDAMVAAFGFLSQRLQKSPTDGGLRCAQLLVLTHNFHFYQLWRDALASAAADDRKAAGQGPLHVLPNRRVSLLELRVELSRCEPRRSFLYELGHSASGRSEYHLLFDYVCGAVSGDDDDHTALLAGNAARRLLESFLRWRVPDQRRLSEAIRRVGSDKQVAVDVISRAERALNATSHRTQVDMNTHQYVGDVVQDLRATLGFMKHLDPEHFEGMCKALDKWPDLGAFDVVGAASVEPRPG